MRERQAVRITAGLAAIVLAVLSVWPFVVQQDVGLLVPTQSVADQHLCKIESYVIKPSETKCRFRLGPLGELTLDGRVITPKLVASFSSSDHVAIASEATVFPEPVNGRYFIIQACDKELCWSLWKFDRKHWTIQQTNAGKYGPERWVRWSKDGRFSVMYSNNEGASWLYSISLAENYADGESQELVSIEPFSFKWVSDAVFSLSVWLPSESRSASRRFAIERKRIVLLR